MSFALHCNNNKAHNPIKKNVEEKGYLHQASYANALHL